MKTKDFVLIAILAVVFFVVYMLINMVTSTAAGVFSYIISVPLITVLTSIIPLLLVRKCPKFGVLSIYTIIWVLITSLMGPIVTWIVSVLLCAFIADIILYYSQYNKLWLTGLAFGIMALGQSLGYVITALFFWDMYSEMFTSRMGDEWMQNFLALFEGITLVMFIVFPLAAGFVGAWLAEKMYNKHFRKALGQQEASAQ